MTLAVGVSGAASQAVLWGKQPVQVAALPAVCSQLAQTDNQAQHESIHCMFQTSGTPVQYHIPLQTVRVMVHTPFLRRLLTAARVARCCLSWGQVLIAGWCPNHAGTFLVDKAQQARSQSHKVLSLHGLYILDVWLLWCV